MDRFLVKSALEQIVSPSNKSFQEAQQRFANMPEEARHDFVVSILAGELTEALRCDPDLSGLMIKHGNGASSFLYSASRYLINSAIGGRADEAIAWFEKVRALKSANILEILPIWGAEPKDTTELLPNVNLVPFDSLPASSQKKILKSPEFAVSTQRPAYAWTPPTAALIAAWTIEPIFYREGENENLQVQNPNLLADVRLCLPVVAPSCIVPTISWFQYEQSDLNFSMFGSGYSIPFLEIQPSQLRSFGEFSAGEAARIVSGYFSLESNKARVHLALDRFDRAMRRHSPADAAVELAIALEALLGDDSAELSWKVSLRAAILVGRTSERRLMARRLVRAIYDLRSTVVHTGRAPHDIKVKGLGKMNTSELLFKGAQIVADVIKTTIAMRILPDWFVAELGD